MEGVRMVEKKMNLLLGLQTWALWLLIILIASLSHSHSHSHSHSLGCQRKCGQVRVPYPFGIDDPKCAKDRHFVLNCNLSDTRNELKLGSNTVINLSLEEGTTTVKTQRAYMCYPNLEDSFRFIDLGDGPFTFSDTRNKLTAVGCDVVVFAEERSYLGGCVAYCNQRVNVMELGSCSGKGCCQTSVPKGLKALNISLIRSGVASGSISHYNPCAYAFLVDQNSFDLSSVNLSALPNQTVATPVVLDWVIGKESCVDFEARRNKSGYACGLNTACLDSHNGQGYRCICKDGFRGNPYLQQHQLQVQHQQLFLEEQGCQDIDECKEEDRYPCKGRCKNTPGNYTCYCPLGMHGNAKVGCEGFRVTAVATVIGGCIIIIILIILVFIEWKRRRREKNFRQNGGLLLEHQRVKIFSEAELAKATNNYDKSRILGQGGSASVYEGLLASNIQAAIKKPKEVDKNQINQQFQHEIGIISQVNHRNVVKLLGLCLETKVPLLVYEFVSNGTLFQHIHDRNSIILRSWKNRLRIAAEIALALDYLHSLADPPIVHRDVKSANILLDDEYTAKVADFGASVLIPRGQTWMDSRIVGTCGYLDPEYLITGILTAKSDVYSFGVVLMELLTGEMPKFVQKFISPVEKDRVLQMIMNAGGIEEGEVKQIEAVVELAKRCLHRSGLERPTMKEVLEVLIKLGKFNEGAFCAPQSSQEADYSTADTQYLTAFNMEPASQSEQPMLR